MNRYILIRKNSRTWQESFIRCRRKKRTGEVILRTQGLGRSFVKNSLFGKSRSLEAVEPLSFKIHKGETFGLVGESGSGKTTLARMLTGIIPPSCGSFSCEGKIQMIFQETSASFDPEFSLERILEEPLVIQKKAPKRSGKNVWQKCSDWFRWKKSTSEKRQRLFPEGSVRELQWQGHYF